MTDDEIAAVVTGPQSERFETQASMSDADKVREAICAFANDLAGSGVPGIVAIGVDDDGAAIGLAVTDDLLLRLAQMRDDGAIVPFPSMEVRTIEVDGCGVAVAIVQLLSPGGPFGQVTIETFGEPGITDYRNPSLAGLLGQLGFVQRFGVGIEIARAALTRNGNPPLELVPTPTHVLAIVRFT